MSGTTTARRVNGLDTLDAEDTALMQAMRAEEPAPEVDTAAAGEATKEAVFRNILIEPVIMEMIT
jgi:hypothetical protein